VPDGQVFEPLSDCQLLAALKVGVERSDWGDRNSILVEFYNRYAPNLATTWLRRTGNPELTQEIIQETFLRATAKLHVMRGTHSVLVWLRTTARNFYLDRTRRSKVERQYWETEAWRAAAPPQPGRSFEDAVLASADRGKAGSIVERYLRALQPQDREVLLLRKRGLQMAQICAELRISQRECRRSYARIRVLAERLRELGLSGYLRDMLETYRFDGDQNEGKPN
jgi:RNA polymerase sigma factor (sigma-70 family)